jgi:hypothetical protein
MTTKTYRLFYFAYPVAVLMLTSLAPIPAQADFFDDARKTFTVDIPHFFQDDVPCFFGGQPTSGAKKSCKPPAHPGESSTDNRADTPSDKTNGSVPQSSNQ